MALSPWPEVQTEIDAAVAVLEAALPDGAASGKARPGCVGSGRGIFPRRSTADSRRERYPLFGLAA